MTSNFGILDLKQMATVYSLACQLFCVEITDDVDDFGILTAKELYLTSCFFIANIHVLSHS